MKIDYKKLTAPYQKELMERLKEFVAINSVYDEKTKDNENEFGTSVSEALLFVQKLAKKDGFKVTNYKNKVVEILVGDGEKNVTILAHADIVPAGSSGWKHNPFELYEEDGILYGRGVADDKGPLLSSYYALKALRDNNLLGNYQVRLLVGGNEESGSRCMEYYFKELKMRQPTLGFSPDSDFPLIYAEKGIGTFIVTGDFAIPHITSIKGGTAFNSVIEKCDVVCDDINFINYVKDNDIDAEISGTTISFIGRSAHGSVPWEGVNAGLIALKAIGDFYKNEYVNQLVLKFNNPYGEGIGCGFKNEEMGTNSLNVGIISFENNKFSMTINFRYINGCNKNDLEKKLKENIKPFTTSNMEFGDLLFYPIDSVLVKTLLNAYIEETGDINAKPLSTGGGTYAKEADNVVAFGMQFPGFDSLMHSPGECSKKEDLFTSMAIYARAIIDLGEKL